MTLAILFIADTHGDLAFHSGRLDNLPHFDICILLGDHSAHDLAVIKEKIDPRKIFGVLGNHDLKDLYKNAGIKDLNGVHLALKIKGRRLVLAGLGGSFKYKDSFATSTA
jgi:predicted phosphodiesterase